MFLLLGGNNLSKNISLPLMKDLILLANLLLRGEKAPIKKSIPMISQSKTKLGIMLFSFLV